MDMRIPRLKLKILLESDPLKSRILVLYGDWEYFRGRSAPAQRERAADAAVASAKSLEQKVEAQGKQDRP